MCRSKHESKISGAIYYCRIDSKEIEREKKRKQFEGLIPEIIESYLYTPQLHKIWGTGFPIKLSREHLPIYLSIDNVFNEIDILHKSLRR